MPKLDGGAIGTAFGYQIDKMTDTVGFEDSTHTYFDLKDGSRYISCTQLIHKYVPEYDEKWWSKYKALQRLSGERFNKYKSQLLQTKKITEEILFDLNITEEELKSEQLVVLKEWGQKRKESCERGERIHKE